MRLKELFARAALPIPKGPADPEITFVTDDSRRVSVGSLFVAIRGFTTDGHDKIGKAIGKGAAALLVDRDYENGGLPDLPLCRTSDARSDFARLCHAFYGCPGERLKLIGVTGTNGKTSVTNLLRQILESALYPCGLIGTVGCDSRGRNLENHNANHLSNLTTPDPSDLYRMLAEMAEDGVEYVVMEVTSHALALGKLAPLTFEAAIFTNLTPEHLDFHGDMESYAAAKAKLFAQSRLSIINADADAAERMKKAAVGRVVTCSQGKYEADYRAGEIFEKGSEGVEYRLLSRSHNLFIRCPIPGRFSLMNSMEAAACALELGVAPGCVKEALSSMRGVKGRMEKVRLGVGADITVIIDYAHTPDALENLLLTLREIKGPRGKLRILFGCGGDRDRTKRPVMGRIASSLADVVYLTSDNSRSEDPASILAEIRRGVTDRCTTFEIPDRKEAIEQAILGADAGDYIVLAGKGHEEYEITREGRFPFHEREIVKQAFAMRRNQNHNDSTGKKR